MGEALVPGVQQDVTREGALLVTRANACTESLKFLGKNLMKNYVERGLRLGDGDVWFTARQNRQPVVPWTLQAIRGHRTKNHGHHHGDANIRIARHFRSVKAWRRDADNANRLVA